MSTIDTTAFERVRRMKRFVLGKAPQGTDGAFMDVCGVMGSPVHQPLVVLFSGSDCAPESFGPATFAVQEALAAPAASVTPAVHHPKRRRRSIIARFFGKPR